MANKAKQIVKEVLDSGFQISTEGLALLKDLSEQTDIGVIIKKIVESKKESAERIISREDVEANVPLSVRQEQALAEVEDTGISSEVEVVRDAAKEVCPSEGKEAFERLFRSRYEKLLKIVKNRPDAFKIRSISSVQKSRVEEQVKIAGLVMSRRMRRNNITLTVEDDTGKLELFALDRDVAESVNEVLLDTFVVADVEFSRRGTAVIRSINLPDVPEHTPNVSKKRVYVVLTSDLHVGSRNFLREEFLKFIEWLKQRDRDQEVVRRIKYLVIAGDIVDGVGVYPGQSAELEISNISEQYAYAAELLKQIPKSIEIFIIPGNHDSVRQALPQPCISANYAGELFKLENVTMLGGPSVVKLHGVSILLFHGRSLDDVIASTPKLTFTRPAVAMKLLLKARHLAPIYGKRTSIAPEPEDHLVIEDIPDVFHAGHVHTLDSEEYRGTLIINSGSWQSQTAYQARMGVMPTPGVIPIVDLSALRLISRDFKASSTARS